MCVIGIYYWVLTPEQQELTWRYALSTEGAVGTPQKASLSGCLLWQFSGLAPALISVYHVSSRSQSKIIRASYSCLLLRGNLLTTQTQQLFSQFRQLMHSGVVLFEKNLCDSLWSRAQDLSLGVFSHWRYPVRVCNSLNFVQITVWHLLSKGTVTGTPETLVKPLSTCQSQWQKLSSKTYLLILRRFDDAVMERGQWKTHSCSCPEETQRKLYCCFSNKT